MRELDWTLETTNSYKLTNEINSKICLRKRGMKSRKNPGRMIFAPNNAQ